MIWRKSLVSLRPSAVRGVSFHSIAKMKMKRTAQLGLVDAVSGQLAITRSMKLYARAVVLDPSKRLIDLVVRGHAT